MFLPFLLTCEMLLDSNLLVHWPQGLRPSSGQFSLIWVSSGFPSPNTSPFLQAFLLPVSLLLQTECSSWNTSSSAPLNRPVTQRPKFNQRDPQWGLRCSLSQLLTLHALTAPRALSLPPVLGCSRFHDCLALFSLLAFSSASSEYFCRFNFSFNNRWVKHADHLSKTTLDFQNLFTNSIWISLKGWH